MKQHYLLSNIEPPKDLLNSILLKIDKTKISEAKKRAVFSLAVSIFSLYSMIETGKYLSVEFYNSGMFNYASLFISDWNSVVYFWKEAIISIAESLPLFGLIVLFGTAAIFLASLKNIVKNTMNINNFKIKTI